MSNGVLKIYPTPRSEAGRILGNVGGLGSGLLFLDARHRESKLTMGFAHNADTQSRAYQLNGVRAHQRSPTP